MPQPSLQSSKQERTDQHPHPCPLPLSPQRCVAYDLGNNAPDAGPVYNVLCILAISHQAPCLYAPGTMKIVDRRRPSHLAPRPYFTPEEPFVHFDALTLACMADELRRTLIPGRVQQVLLVDEHSLGLEVYAGSVRHQLLLAADSAAPRIQRLAHKLRRGVEQETPFLLLLRKYVRDASLEQVLQPDPAERVLHLHFAHRTLGPTLLVAELLGRQSNLLLLRGDRILDCLRRVTPEDPAGRWLQPGRPYAPPPPQAKLPPLDDGSPDYYARLAALLQQPGKRWKALVDGVAGLSPTAARELVWQVTGAAETTAPVELLPVVEALQALWQRAQTGSWQPGVALEESAVVAFAAYPLHFRGVFQATADLSAALAAFYGAPDRPAPDPYAGQRAQVQALLRKAEQRLLRRLAALAGDEPAPGEPERLRQAAEWLLALSSTITPESARAGGGSRE